MSRYPIALLILIFAGCSTTVDQARQTIEAQLAMPQTVSMEDTERFSGGVVCGKYTALDASGFSVRKVPYIFYEGTVYKRPSAEQTSIFCTDEPATALFDALGIGPWSRENAELLQIYSDLKTIDGALRAHMADHGDVPVSGGLSPLAEPASGYLTTIPVDPWGNAYHFELGLGGRGSRGYELYTLGADNAPGGSGSNADVHRAALPYLDRLDALTR